MGSIHQYSVISQWYILSWGIVKSTSCHGAYTSVQYDKSTVHTVMGHIHQYYNITIHRCIPLWGVYMYITTNQKYIPVMKYISEAHPVMGTIPQVGVYPVMGPRQRDILSRAPGRGISCHGTQAGLHPAMDPGRGTSCNGAQARVYTVMEPRQGYFLSWGPGRGTPVMGPRQGYILS